MTWACTQTQPNICQSGHETNCNELVTDLYMQRQPLYSANESNPIAPRPLGVCPSSQSFFHASCPYLGFPPSWPRISCSSIALESRTTVHLLLTIDFRAGKACILRTSCRLNFCRLRTHNSCHKHRLYCFGFAQTLWFASKSCSMKRCECQLPLLPQVSFVNATLQNNSLVGLFIHSCFVRRTKVGSSCYTMSTLEGGLAGDGRNKS